MNKRGWLRIVEASVGILIVVGVLLTLYAQQADTKDLSAEIYELQIYILNEIAENYRNDILNSNEPTSDMISFATGKIPANFNFVIRICGIKEVCGLGEDGPEYGNVYTEERVVSANLEKYYPKKIKLYIWEGQ